MISARRFILASILGFLVLPSAEAIGKQDGPQSINFGSGDNDESPRQPLRKDPRVLVIETNGHDPGGLTINGKRYSLEEVIVKFPTVAKTMKVKEKVELLKKGANWRLPDRAPQQPAPSGKEVSDEVREKVANRALRRLHLDSYKGYSNPMGMTGKMVTVSLAGLAFLSADGNLRTGRYAKAVAEIERSLLAWSGEESEAHRLYLEEKWDQRTWAYAHGAIFLAELYARGKSPEVKQGLARYVKWIEAAQTEAGGWGHHPQGKPCPHGYRELNVVTDLCLVALGLAKRVDVSVHDDVVSKGLRCLSDSVSPSGAVAYSNGLRFDRGEVGRNAGAILAFIINEKTDDPAFPLMVNWMRGHMGSLELCSDSPVLAIFLGSTASAALGKDDWRNYWACWGGPIVARLKNSSAIDPPNPLLEYDCGDRSTTTQIIALCLPRKQLKLLSSLSCPEVKPAGKQDAGILELSPAGK